MWAELPVDARRALEVELPPADLRSLQLDLARTRAAEVTPADVMRQWDFDRFVRPSTADPRGLLRVEARLWDLLPDRFQGVELSPVVPARHLLGGQHHRPKPGGQHRAGNRGGQ